ncbi:restriction endonuclease subunit S [Vibrio splendidus]
MSELPKGWRATLLNEVVDKIVGGGTPSKSVPSYYEGDIPWMTVKDMNKSYLTDTIDHITQEAIDNSSTNVIPAGTPIIATRMSLGKIVRASFDSAINQDLKALFVNREVDDYYFEYWYRSQGLKIESLGTGTTVKGVRLEVINALEFPLPPLAEQKRIVEKLDEVLAQVDTIKARLDGIPDLLKRFRQSVLASAVSGKLTEEWRGSHIIESQQVDSILESRKDLWVKNEERKLREKNNSPFVKWKGKYKTPSVDPEEKFNTPDTWLNIRADVLSFLITDGKHGDCSNDEESGYYFISAKDIFNGKINYSNARQINSSEFREVHFRTNLELGDVLVTNAGTIGRVAVATEELMLSKTTFQKSVAVIKLVKNHISSKYFALYLEAGVERLKNKSSGTAVKNLLLRDIRDMSISLPSIAEQKEIVRLVDQYFAFADTIEAQVKKAQARVDNLTQSILAKAFRGELVAQDSSDEPADKLLERIAEARKEAEALAKAAKKAEAAKKKAEKAAAKG